MLFRYKTKIFLFQSVFLKKTTIYLTIPNKLHLFCCVSAAHFSLVSWHHLTGAARGPLGHCFAGVLVAALPPPLPTIRLPLKGYLSLPCHYRQCSIRTALRSHGRGSGALQFFRRTVICNSFFMFFVSLKCSHFANSEHFLPPMFQRGIRVFEFGCHIFTGYPFGFHNVFFQLR